MKIIKTASKILTVLLAISILAGALAGCSEAKYREKKSSKSEREVVATVDGYDISYELYRYLFANYNVELYEDEDAARADGYGETLDAIDDALRDLYAIYALCGQHEIDTDSIYIRDSLDNYMIEVIDAYGSRRDYLGDLDVGYSTDAVFRFLAKTDFCEEALFDVLYSDDNGIVDTSDAAVEEYFLSDDCFAYYMLEFYRDGSDASREHAEEMYERVLATTTAKEFRSLYGYSVTTYSETIDGFLFYVGEGELEEKYEEIILSLDEGEVSELIEGNGAYFVFRRAKKNLSDMNEDDKSYVYIKTSYVNFMMRELIDEISDGMTLEYKDSAALIEKLEGDIYK